MWPCHHSGGPFPGNSSIQLLKSFWAVPQLFRIQGSSIRNAPVTLRREGSAPGLWEKSRVLAYPLSQLSREGHWQFWVSPHGRRSSQRRIPPSCATGSDLPRKAGIAWGVPKGSDKSAERETRETRTGEDVGTEVILYHRGFGDDNECAGSAPRQGH